MEKFIELKNKKLEYLNNIYDLTLKQKEALETEDIELLQKLIIFKQEYMDKINQIDEKIEQMEERYIKELEESCRKILAAIIEIDNSNRQKANGFFLILKEKIRKIRQGKKVYNAYNPSFSNSAFINRVR
ncbi:MAG: flagellar protein FlgN [Clostridia bacterium]|nr:flagellar protein FlgN [Clostridia bacterium]